jgi:hypothetical protein
MASYEISGKNGSHKPTPKSHKKGLDVTPESFSSNDCKVIQYLLMAGQLHLEQGDQIGRIYNHVMIVYFGQFF